MAAPAARPPLGREARLALGGVEGLALAVILLAAAQVWLTPGGPGWYPDEGAHLAIAQNLLRGRTQFLAVNQSVLLFSRLPLFEWLLAGALALAGAGPGDAVARGMVGLRGLTGGLAVLNTLGVYLVARPLAAEASWSEARRWLPLLAAALFVVYPAAVIAGRFGFSYHLLATLLLGAVAAAGAYLGQAGGRWHLALAAALIGLGALTDVWGWVLIPLLTLVVAAKFEWGRQWRRDWPLATRHLAVAGIALVPLATYVALQLLTVPSAFLFDLRFVLGRAQGQPGLWQLLDNGVTLVSQDGWLALGAVGLLALRPARLRTAALLLGGGALLLIGRSTPLYSLSFYYLIPLLPLVPLGLAGLVSAVPGQWRSWAAYGVLVALAVGAWFNLSVGPMRDGFWRSPVDEVVITPHEAQAAVDYLATVRAPDELVLASPALAWLLPGDVADVQMALAYTGRPTPHVPANLPRNRYAYNPSFARAQYVVVDNVWRNWAVYNVGGAAELLAEVERWPAVFTDGAVVVYQRP